VGYKWFEDDSSDILLEAIKKYEDIYEDNFYDDTSDEILSACKPF